MFALAAALLVSPAVPPKSPGESDARWVPPGAVIPEGLLAPQGGGFGGGGFDGFPGTAFAPGAAATQETGELFIQGRRVLVLISPDGSQVWGWSQASGKMTPLPVEVPEEERGEVEPVLSQSVAMLTVGGVAYAFGGSSGEWGSHPIGDRPDGVDGFGTPIVGTSVAAIRTADGVYAYSGETGTGGLHPLEENEEAVGPAVGQDYVMVRSPQSFGMFSGETGTWGSVRYEAPADDAKDEPSAASDDD